METQQTAPKDALAELLAALPEMFPGTQQVPLANIRPNPENPGAPITEEQIQDLADNLAARGLLNPIRVQPDWENPLARGAQPHPDNPRLRADGQPWELGDFNFMVLTGENRYRAALKLQWPTIKGAIHNLSALDTAEAIHLDNEVRDRGWWAAHQSIEQTIKAGPNLTQQQVATRLKIRLESVNWALRLLPLLNAEARGLIIPIRNNSNKGNKGISETAASWLADLGPETTLKRGARKKDLAEGEEAQKLWPYPAIPPETQDLVRRALAVACDHRMTETQVKRLVGWVKGGNSPESYTPSAKAGKVEGDRKSPTPSFAEEGLAHPKPEASTPATSPHLSPLPQGVKAEGSQKEAPAQGMGTGETLALEALAGMSVLTKIEAKLKKGESLTPGEVVVLVLRSIAEAALWAWKHLVKPGFKLLLSLAKKTVHLILKSLKGVLHLAKEVVGEPLVKIGQFVVLIALIIGLGWVVLDMFRHGWQHPFRMLGSAVTSRWDAAFAPKPAPQAVVTNPIVPANPPPVSQAEQKPETALPKPENSSLAQPQPVAGTEAPQQAAAPAPASDKNAVASVPTLLPTPAAQKKDVLGQVAGAVGTGGAAVNVAKKIFGF